MRNWYPGDTTLWNALFTAHTFSWREYRYTHTHPTHTHTHTHRCTETSTQAPEHTQGDGCLDNLQASLSSFPSLSQSSVFATEKSRHSLKPVRESFHILWHYPIVSCWTGSAALYGWKSGNWESRNKSLILYSGLFFETFLSHRTWRETAPWDDPTMSSVFHLLKFKAL